MTDLTPSEPDTPNEGLTVYNYNTDNNVGNINVMINTLYSLGSSVDSIMTKVDQKRHKLQRHRLMQRQREREGEKLAPGFVLLKRTHE